MKKPVAIKFTWALEDVGGFWVAYSDRSTEYFSKAVELPPVHRDLQLVAVSRTGMWLVLPEYAKDASFMDAWKKLSLV